MVAASQLSLGHVLVQERLSRETRAENILFANSQQAFLSLEDFTSNPNNKIHLLKLNMFCLELIILSILH